MTGILPGIRTIAALLLGAAIVLLVAIAFLYGGVRLIAVGGSLYYVLAGIALLTSAILLWRGNKLGSHIYGIKVNPDHLIPA